MKINNRNYHASIKDIYAYKQYDSRGYPSIAVLMTSTNNIVVKSIIPSGASVGKKEAHELRDNHKDVFDGKGVDKAIRIINSLIRRKIVGMNPFNQTQIDDILIRLDGTVNKSKLGANSILAISIASCKLAAKIMNMPLYAYIAKNLYKKTNYHFKLPNIMVNVINGGMHACNALDFQEFMFVPLRYKTIDEACGMVGQCFHELGKILIKKKMSVAKGDEGGYDTSVQSIYDALDLMEKAMMNCRLKSGKDMAIAIDVAANTFYSRGNYFFKRAFLNKEMTKFEATKNRNQMIELYIDLIKYYPIMSLEDPLYEDDWFGFNQLTHKLQKHNVMVVGDDLYCTNEKFIKKGIKEKSSNATIIKLNQIGTISETIDAIKVAKRANMKIIISHRSGDNEDAFISDFAVAVDADYLKSGGFSRSERLSKYNRLLEIENMITKKSKISI